MTHEEVVKLWVPYMHKRGTLHLGMRMDQGFALLASIIHQALGGKAKQKDFMHYIDKPGMDLAEASIEDVMTVLTRSARQTKAATKGKPRKASDQYLSGKE